MLRIFKIPDLRKKILFSLFTIAVFRFLAHIPVPGVDISAIKEFISGNDLLGLFDYFSGGGFQNFSIVTLGLGPYINASIVMQIFAKLIPSLEELAQEGEQGREKINQYTKFLTVPIALLQSYGVYFLLSRQGVIVSLDLFSLVILLLTLVGGGILLMWIGDLVTEYGVGNGISLLIFVGIISRMPLSAAQFVASLTSESVITALVYIVLSVIVIVGVVLINEGTRNINLEYGRRGFGMQRVTNYLPIKVNQAGVIPIIFALSVVIIPSLIAGPLQTVSVSFLRNLGSFLAVNFSSASALYNILYFLLVVGFTYFYTSIQFDPAKISDDIKKRGGFIPGIRPGKATTEYLGRIVNRITLVGALFLGIIAILPFLVRGSIGIGGLEIGGTGLLIVVSVVLETMRQIESMMVTRSYDSFLR